MLSSLWVQNYSLGSSNLFEHKPCPPGEQKTHLTHTWSQEHSHAAGMNNDHIYWRPKKDIVLFAFLILFIFSINVCSKYNHFCVQILDICGYKRELLSKNILGYPLSCWKMRPLPDFWGSDPLWWQSWQLCPNTVSSGCRWLLTFRSSVPGWNQPCLRCSLARCWLYYCMRQTQRIIGGNFWSNSSLLANKLWKKKFQLNLKTDYISCKESLGQRHFYAKSHTELGQNTLWSHP